MKNVILSDRESRKIMYSTSFANDSGVIIDVLFLENEDIVVGLGGQFRHMSKSLHVEGSNIYFSGESVDGKGSTLKFYDNVVVVMVNASNKICYINSGRKVAIF